jgi:beta-phosphoglucomutase-like phosphatase (HAD superfamily)
VIVSEYAREPVTLCVVSCDHSRTRLGLPRTIRACLFDLDRVLTPDTFLAAAKALEVDAGEAAVFEDALAGVAAGQAGGFGFVVGVDRVGQADALREHGADIVVRDLAELLE